MAIILPDKILTEVDQAKERIDDRKMDDYISQMHQRLVSEVQENSSKLDADNRNRAGKVINGFKNAWEQSIRSYKDKGVTVEYLGDIVGLLEPELCVAGQNYAELRNGSAGLNFGINFQYRPPTDKGRIQEHLDRMTKVIGENSLHPLEQAVFLNFHLMRIQPFENGNKRLANVVTNTVLCDNGFFPVSFKDQEGELFKDYFKSAIKDFRESEASSDKPELAYSQPSSGQRQFYDFIARKELMELRTAEDRLKGLHQYHLSLELKDRGTIYSVKKQIRSWFDARKLLYQEKIRADKGEIELIGDIPEGVIHDILRHSRGVRKYSLKSNGRH